MPSAFIFILLFSFLNCAFAIQPTSWNTDHESLIQFYKENCGTSSWGINSNWLMAFSDHCQWEGVLCREQRVVNLTLSGKNLHGQLSSTLGFLDQLEVLDLSDNQLSGSLPESFKNLSNMMTLHLEKNHLSDIPGDLFENIEHLRNLTLGSNPIGSFDAQIFSDLRNLSGLDLSSTQLKILPDEISLMTRLVWVDLSQNVNLRGAEKLFQSPLLTYFDLHSVNLQRWPTEVRLPQIQQLFLQNNNFEAFPTSICELTTLVRLVISDNHFPEIPSEFNLLRELKFFECERCSITSFPNLELHSLQKLDLQENADLILLNLTGLPGLVTVSCSAREIVPKSFAGFTNLLDINLFNQENFPSELPRSLLYMASYNCSTKEWPTSYNTVQLPSLSRWEIYQHRVPLSFPEFLFRSSPEIEQPLFLNLTYLGLSGPFTGTIPSSFNHPNLSTISMSETWISGTIPPEISKITSLNTLELTGNLNLTGSIPDEILKCTNLTHLRLSDNHLDPFLPRSLQPLTKLPFCDLSNNNPPFKCQSQNFGDQICNVQCEGDSMEGMWVTEQNTCKESLLNAKWNQSKIFIDGAEFTYVSQDSLDCITPKLSYKIEGSIDVVEINQTSARVYEGKMVFNVSKVWVQANSADAALLLSTVCYGGNYIFDFPIGVWRDDFTTFPCTGSGYGFNLWFPSIQSCSAYHEIFHFDAEHGALNFGEGLMWNLEKCQKYPSTFSQDLLRRNWTCETEFVDSCTPECGDGVILPPETCDLGGGQKGTQGTGCFNCQVEKGWTCQDQEDPGHSVCTPDKNPHQYFLALGLGLALGVVAVALGAVFMGWKLHQNQSELVIKDEELELGEILGEGKFGKVFKGVWRGTTEVAVKVLKAESFSNRELDLFRAEAQLFMKLPPHPNIVQFLGISLGSQKNKVKKKLEEGSRGEDLCSTKLVTEFMREGNLISYLRSKIVGEEFLADLSLVLQLGKGIAAGMDHLHSNNIIHRDLAARNILIHSSSSTPRTHSIIRVIPKISDFGLSTARSKSNTTIPVRWTAPEVFLNPRSAQPKSDVWSFGVVLFEISVSCTIIPYPHLLTNREVRQAVLAGQHPTFPSGLPAHFVSLAKSCFALVPSLRPTFSQLFDGLVEQERLLETVDERSVLERQDAEENMDEFDSSLEYSQKYRALPSVYELPGNCA